jgi:16S rRNA (uracil1498-N3)-methyltransferase
MSSCIDGPSGRRPRTRLYVAAGLAAGLPTPLESGQAHQLKTVLRAAPGDRVLLFNGRDGEWLARLDSLGKTAATATPERQTRPQQAGADLWLCFAPIKRARIDFVAEKATELGATAIQPVVTRHTDVARVNVERLRAHAVEAAEQCERLDLPEVRDPLSFDALIAGWEPDRLLAYAAEAGAAQPIAAAARSHAGRPAALLVGPEGGFAQEELDALRKLPFALAIGLGPRILRADTATVAALACWQAAAGDWSDRPPHRV